MKSSRVYTGVYFHAPSDIHASEEDFQFRVLREHANLSCSCYVALCEMATTDRRERRQQSRIDYEMSNRSRMREITRFLF